eukprot:3414675-Amphidinium_carterae.3
MPSTTEAVISNHLSVNLLLRCDQVRNLKYTHTAPTKLMASRPCKFSNKGNDSRQDWAVKL